MPRMRVVQVATKGGPFELVERELPEPGPGEVRVRVQACGVCHSDSIGKEGLFPSVPYPIVPGHEIAGVIDAIGAGVIGWEVGTRVGVGWFGGHCGRCEPCRRGDLVDCRNLRIPGVTYDGGYAEAMIAPADALALIPDELSPVEAAPLLCAGVTTFHALRESGARPGDLVAILGIGGLGHLGVQFAAKMGFRTVAIARGQDKEPLARQLGAHVYLDSRSQDVAAELARLGGAKTILATVTSGKAMSAVIPGLAVRGRLIVVGVGMDPIEVPALDLIGGSRSVVGHASGSSIDSQDTLAFSAFSGVRPTIETMPLERAGEAYDRMMRNEARFRMVLTTGL
ncbi:Alcohol dehydrogenase catalytic domain-containing protein [Rhodovastum atsumiense]|uniref:Alcohol dehydrogenase catalytic domain-containing protein n=1 Tax=Rhodovastum atsumiense TaxID=504468 RepID=A0A5M6IMK5_9PROT|nr:alcohol dehydrogenase [Rhodovastum atsumiense]KAA5608778.1 alcohol dehydrogenase catalytic domain-containing protein [Rhodovastum atsumiense]CAH2602870.1 Alcohol dehydrogenase catalytic domain-containing protein [Rhodovastum atsumiense]